MERTGHVVNHFVPVDQPERRTLGDDGHRHQVRVVFETTVNLVIQRWW